LPTEDPHEFPIQNKPVRVTGFSTDKTGFESLIAIVTDTPIDFRQIFNPVQTRGFGLNSRSGIKDEFLLLLKGSPVSDFYPYVKTGQLKLASISFQTIGNTDNQLTRSIIETPAGVDTKYMSFYNSDSSKIYSSPPEISSFTEIDFPVLQIIDPETIATRAERKSESPSLRFRGIAVDRAYGIKSIAINGRPVKSLDTLTGFFDDTYNLVPGSNEIAVSAINTAGLKTTQLLKFTYDDNANKLNRSGEDHLLVIGINEYSSYKHLKNAVKDAIDFSALMINDFGFKPGNVISLFDQNATADSIYSALSYLANKLGENDRLLIYFAGHGIYDENLSLGYWVPVNAAPNKRSQLIPNNMISRYISSFRAKKVFAIIDACYSGTLLEDTKRDVGSDSAYINRIRNFKCRQILASGRREVVADGSGTNSPFALALLTYLKKTNSPEILSRDIISYVMKNVTKTEKQTPIGGALKDVNDESGEFEFVRKK
jgi:hypothetical protein